MDASLEVLDKHRRFLADPDSRLGLSFARSIDEYSTISDFFLNGKDYALTCWQFIKYGHLNPRIAPRPVISSHVMSHVAELGQGQATPA